MPKTNLYYALEKELQTFDITLSNETIIEHPFSLELQNIDVATKAVLTAKVSDVALNFFFFSNTLLLKNIELAPLLNNYLPQQIKKVKLQYTLLNPLHITAAMQGDFGAAVADYALVKNHFELILTPSKTLVNNYHNSLREFTKQANGEYIYAKDF